MSYLKVFFADLGSWFEVRRSPKEDQAVLMFVYL
jgi:hypothetical protein